VNVRALSRRGRPHPLAWRQYGLVAVVGVLFLLAAGIRLYNIQKPFVGLLPVREFRSAIIARDLYFALNQNAPEWAQDVSTVSRAREWSLEPPLLEGLTAVTYTVLGSEQLWIPRLYATLFWLLSGLVFWRIGWDLFGGGTAVFLTAYYLFLPIGVIASKSFQPDSLMMLFYLASLWAILRYDQTPTRRSLLWAMLFSAIALFIRPLAIFPIAAAFAALFAYRFTQGERRPLAHLALSGASLLVGLSYYTYGLLISDSLAGQAEISFLPHLLRLPYFWQSWLTTGLSALTLIGLIAALVGLALLHSPRLQWLLAGLWGSYFVYGIIFDYHISTHNYYHLQVVPTVALSAGPLIALLLERARSLKYSQMRVLWLYGVLALFVLMGLRQVVQQGRQTAVFESPALAQEIGQLVNHSTTTVYLSPFYGRPLEYFGQLSGAYWPRPTSFGIYNPDGAHNSSIAERLSTLNFTPDYFIITHLSEYHNHHADLEAYLTENCELISDNEQYFVFNNCN
jgi:4-amino-4-deoxy-L-arabinose transferase-like glycosyltransferase